jgi:hypothetical protein
MNDTNHLTIPIAEALGVKSPKVADLVFESSKSKVSHGRPSRPLWGLPLRRVISQDVHSLLDYSSGLALFASAALAKRPAAMWAGVALGSALIGVSALTDYRLSLAKLVPIEAHEVSDYLGGLSAVAAPFAFGYGKRSRAATWLQLSVGLGTILASLFTDYRAQRGVSLR